ncbi:ABC transporter permease [Tersicoccus solisilvae]|uniref:ABC transporter permease n=1 Tax=Tersicoccus solisilvae TaxID=1882339 RepID=A0ABQ1P828_9MICC|nr:ABC transporter permease [Tersicoccus solisilvae]
MSTQDPTDGPPTADRSENDGSRADEAAKPTSTDQSAGEGATPPPAAAPAGGGLVKDDSSASVARRIFSGNGLVAVLSVVAAVILGGILIAATDEATVAASGYFFARPTDTISAGFTAAMNAYAALFSGAIVNPEAEGVTGMLYPISETLTVATPLILAGLGVTLAFRAGLFNIGAQGQILLGATFAAWVGFTWHLPVGLHIVVAVIAAIVGGAIWGGIPGFLKSRTGAHEVIVTIMLNYVAIYLVQYLLTQPSFQRPGSSNPISPLVDDSAMFPQLLGPDLRLHAGFLVAVAAVVVVWWLLGRSTIGFEFRAVGANPHAARTAGINVTRATVLVMVIAGALAGLAGVAQVSGTERALTSDIAASFGFDAITVALLGRSTPWGTFFAGLLFGAFRAGGVAMQTQTGTPIDIVLVVQSLIVLFLAAPPLVRALFRLPDPGRPRRSRRQQRRRAATVSTGGAA